MASRGVGRLVGPTGGYLIGYLAVALITGWLVDHFETKLPMYFVGFLFCYFAAASILFLF